MKELYCGLLPLLTFVLSLVALLFLGRQKASTLHPDLPFRGECRDRRWGPLASGGAQRPFKARWGEDFWGAPF